MVRMNLSPSSRSAVSRGIVIVVVVLILVVAAVGAYYLTQTPSGPTSTTTPPTSTNTSTSATSVTTTSTTTSPTSQTTSAVAYGPSNSSQLIDETPSSPYDSLDPHYGFFTVDTHFAQVFQGLVQYNGTDFLHVVPSLASSWKVSGNLENYTFTMRQNTWFSNKDPINAYVAWFSFVRVNYINAPTTVGYSNYVSLLYNKSAAPDAHGNVIPWGLKEAVSSVFHLNVNNENAVVAAINDVMSHFNTNNASVKAVMAYPHQALVATNSSTFQVNLLQPYSLFLLALPPQWGALVDPVYLDANGGTVTNNSATAVANWMNTMPGSGPYEYANIGAAQSFIVFHANPNYWAAGVAGLAPVLQPAHIPVIVMKFGVAENTVINDFDTNQAQINGGVPPVIGIPHFQALWNGFQMKSHYKFSDIFHNLGFPLCDLAAGMNTQKYPTNNTNFREAVVHSINYTEVNEQLYNFNGTSLGELYLPPVPPGFGPLDNPLNTPLYSFDVNLAAQYLNKAGLQEHFYTVMQNGTTLGDTNGKLLAPVEYDYIVPLYPELQTQLQIFQQGLAQIGISMAPQGITTGVYDALEASPQTAPPITGVGWCADWPDPIFQQFLDMATEAAHQPNWVDNATLNNLAYKIPFETNAAQQLADATKAYAIFTQLATIIQLPNAAVYFFSQPYVHGFVFQPFQFALYYNMLYYQA